MSVFTFSPLTPTSFLDRSAAIYPQRTAIVDGEHRYTYSEFRDRSLRIAGLLAGRGITPGARVAVLCRNSHTLLELHNAVPYLGAVLVPLNLRLSATELTYVVEHSGASLLIATSDCADTARAVSAATGVAVIVESDDQEGQLAGSDPGHPLVDVDEAAPIAISYTSGTTGRPKGVVYHRRGAYLQSLAMAFHTQLNSESSYLWTLPQFHCDGWCFTWAVTAAGGTHVCLPAFAANTVWQLLEQESVTHLSAAPTVLNMIAASDRAHRLKNPGGLRVSTGGAPPSPTLLERLANLNFAVTHLYGLTETFGPIVINDWQPAWDEWPTATARLRARQGVPNLVADRVRVVTEAGMDVPADGETMGEIVCRGNDVMLEYYRDPEATAAATIDGWLRTGDLGVMHSDGYLELRDRAKDVIISGGENISSVEVERLLDSIPRSSKARSSPGRTRFGVSDPSPSSCRARAPRPTRPRWRRGRAIASPTSRSPRSSALYRHFPRRVLARSRKQPSDRSSSSKTTGTGRVPREPRRAVVRRHVEVALDRSV